MRAGLRFVEFAKIVIYSFKVLITSDNEKRYTF